MFEMDVPPSLGDIMVTAECTTRSIIITFQYTVAPAYKDNPYCKMKVAL